MPIIRVKIGEQYDLELGEYEFAVAKQGSVSSAGLYTPPSTPQQDVIDRYVFYPARNEAARTERVGVDVYNQYIIIKVDDWQLQGGTWETYLHYMRDRDGGIKNSVGVIVYGAFTDPGYSITRTRDLCKDLHNRNISEMWCHGYTHAVEPAGAGTHEFEGTTYAYQLAALQNAHADMITNVDIDMKTFGAPDNAVDANTALALDAADLFETWLFGEGTTELTILSQSQRLNVELSTSHPDYATFVANYDAAAQAETMQIIQIHPGATTFTETYWSEWTAILDDLVAAEVTFINADEYAKLALGTRLPAPVDGAPTDTDGDDIPDYLDEDADGDNVQDDLQNAAAAKFGVSSGVVRRRV